MSVRWRCLAPPPTRPAPGSPPVRARCRRGGERCRPAYFPGVFRDVVLFHVVDGFPEVRGVKGGACRRTAPNIPATDVAERLKRLFAATPVPRYLYLLLRLEDTGVLEDIKEQCRRAGPPSTRKWETQLRLDSRSPSRLRPAAVRNAVSASRGREVGRCGNTSIYAASLWLTLWPSNLKDQCVIEWSAYRHWINPGPYGCDYPRCFPVVVDLMELSWLPR